jgi:hypothetical protein
MCVSAINQERLVLAEEPTYELTNELKIDGETVGWTYEIYIKIENIGDIRSKETVVNLTDEEGFVLQDIVTLAPGETKTVSFTWSTLSSYDQTIAVSYYPLDISIDRNRYNSGSTSFKLLIDGGRSDEIPAASTPGFEIMAFITAMIITNLLLSKKINKKKL